MNMRKFRDLMASEELYFRRADLFEDENEGFDPGKGPSTEEGNP